MKNPLLFILCIAGCAALSAQTSPAAFRQIAGVPATTAPETPARLPDACFIKPAAALSSFQQALAPVRARFSIGQSTGP
jgi:hypothetical protein